MTFSERLKQLREEEGKTQKDIADIIGVGRPTIAGYETKGKQPDYNKLAILADYFDVTIDYLLGRNNIRKPFNCNKSISKALYCFDFEGIPKKAIKQIEDYIEYIKIKYNSKEKSKNTHKR